MFSTFVSIDNLHFIVVYSSSSCTLDLLNLCSKWLCDENRVYPGIHSYTNVVGISAMVLCHFWFVYLETSRNP